MSWNMIEDQEVFYVRVGNRENNKFCGGYVVLEALRERQKTGKQLEAQSWISEDRQKCVSHHFMVVDGLGEESSQRIQKLLEE